MASRAARVTITDAGVHQWANEPELAGGAHVAIMNG